MQAIHAIAGSASGARQGGRVCIVTETYPPEINGVANTLLHFVTGLQARGHDVSLIRPRQEKEHDQAAINGIRQHLLPGLPLPGYKHLMLGLPAAAKLIKIWKQHKPDVVYVATEGPLGWSAIHRAARMKIPVVSGFHTNFHQYMHHYRLGMAKGIAFRYLRYLHNRANCTIVPTEALQQELTQTGFDSVKVISRGVDTQLFSPKKRDPALRRSWGLMENDLAVIYVGRIASEKNLPLAVRCFRAMREKDERLRFIVVGSGPSSEQLAADNPDFIFCGSQTGAALAAHYASADILLFPSETETFGNVVMEGMASGLATVAYRYAAAAEHIEHNNNGVSAELGKENEFIASALSLLDDKLSFQVMRIQARHHAQKNSWSVVLDNLETLLLGCAGKEMD